MTTVIGRDTRGKREEMIGRMGMEEKIESDSHCRHDHCGTTRVIYLQDHGTSHKNAIYSIMQKVTEFAKFWMNESSVNLITTIFTIINPKIAHCKIARSSVLLM